MRRFNEISMNFRSALGSLQLPVAAVGALLVAFAVDSILSLASAPAPDGEGFVRGLTMVVLYAAGLFGFVVFALGLAIRPGEGHGVSFRRRQRRLLFAGAGATAAALLLPLVGTGVLYGTALGDSQLPLYLWGLLHVVGALSVGTALAWRGAEAIRSLAEGTA